MDASRPSNRTNGSLIVFRRWTASTELVPKGSEFGNSCSHCVVGEPTGVVDVTSQINRLVADLFTLATKEFTVLGCHCPKQRLVRVQGSINQVCKGFHCCKCCTNGLHTWWFRLPVNKTYCLDWQHCGFNHMMQGHVDQNYSYDRQGVTFWISSAGKDWFRASLTMKDR